MFRAILIPAGVALLILAAVAAAALLAPPASRLCDRAGEVAYDVVAAIRAALGRAVDRAGELAGERLEGRRIRRRLQEDLLRGRDESAEPVWIINGVPIAGPLPLATHLIDEMPGRGCIYRIERRPGTRPIARFV
jgi:hypothetical protein